MVLAIIASMLKVMNIFNIFNPSTLLYQYLALLPVYMGPVEACCQMSSVSFLGRAAGKSNGLVTIISDFFWIFPEFLSVY